MIYTSYFAKLKQLPENMVPIAICAKKPQWYRGLHYKALAPKYGFFMRWKEDHDNDEYTRCFNDEVLANLNPRRVSQTLFDLAKSRNNWEPVSDIVLLCYEKPSDFCHRHLVAEWFRKYGIVCKEWGEI